jgi:hypothetical protein
MVITPTLRGLFGIDIDAQTKTITVNPHLPREWYRMNPEVKGLRTPDGTFNLTFDLQDYGVRIIYRAEGMQGWKLRSDSEASRPASGDPRELIISAPIVEIGLPIELTCCNLLPGSRTIAPRVLHEEHSKNSVMLVVEGPAGSAASLPVTEKIAKTVGKMKLDVSDGLSNHAKPGEPGAALDYLYMGDGKLTPPFSSMLNIHFPPGKGWKTITVTLTW